MHELRFVRTQRRNGKASGFLLSLLSPVRRAKLCGEIGTKEKHVLILDDKDKSLFWKVVALGCGESVTVGEGLDELIGLAKMADL